MQGGTGGACCHYFQCLCCRSGGASWAQMQRSPEDVGPHKPFSLAWNPCSELPGLRGPCVSAPLVQNLYQTSGWQYAGPHKLLAPAADAGLAAGEGLHGPSVWGTAVRLLGSEHSGFSPWHVVMVGTLNRPGLLADGQGAIESKSKPASSLSLVQQCWQMFWPPSLQMPGSGQLDQHCAEPGGCPCILSDSQAN